MLLIFLATPLLAGSPGNHFAHLWQSEEGYFTRLWQTEDGLPQNSVTAIVQTRDGYLWLGTYSGLARFDGVRFAVFDNNSSPNLKITRISSLFEDAGGVLWIGHDTGQVSRFRDGRFEDVTTPAAWRATKVLAINADETGEIWLVSDEGLLVRLRDGLAPVPLEGPAVGQVSVARDTEGRLWIVRYGRLSRLESGKLVPVELENELPDVYVQGICASRNGGIWISCNGRVRQWRGKTWDRDLGAAPWGVRGITAMLETANGSVLAGTVDSGLYLVAQGIKPLHFNQTNVLSQNWVRSLCEDQEGNLWIGPGSGLVGLRARKVAALSPPDRWQGRPVLSISPGIDESLWITTEGAGLYHFKAGQWEHFGEGEGLSNLFVWSAKEDEDGRLWVATWGGGLFVKENGRFVRVKGMETNTTAMTAIFHAPNHVTWIGSRNGLLRYEAGVVTQFGVAEGLESPDVRTITRSDDGTIWFGMTGGGLGQLGPDGRLKQFKMADGLSSAEVQCLQLEKDGTLWIGTVGGGLTRLRNGKFTAITTREGLEDNIVSHIEEDSRGYFWISSHKGIMRVSKAELNACADGLTNKVNCLAYGKGEGLPTLECTGGMQPSGCKTVEGLFLFPTSKGAVIIDPNEAKANGRPPPVVIEDLLVEQQPVQPEKGGAGRLRIKPGRQQFDFYYAGLSFTVPEKVRFRYRLEGLETQWRDAGAKRSVNYSYIPPGDYRFHVTACNNDGVWNPVPASLAFTVLPHFWQTWWFQAAATLAGAGLVAGTVGVAMRRRLQRKLGGIERQRAVERERARIAKDIHDELGASLTRISMLSQSARAELDHSAAATDLDRIYDTARDTTRAMDEIVWAVNPQHDTLDSLATYLGKFAQDFLAAAHIRCRLEVPIQLPAWPLTAEVRHNLFLAFKEAVNNAVKHAGTIEVRIIVQIASDHFTLQVQDEGCGFAGNGAASSEIARFAGGNGLKNMRQRLAEIGGRCEIRSAPGKGTTVIFNLPVRTVEKV